MKGEKNMNHNFSDNIKKIRKENNLSQEQLAEELGVSRQAISKWESGTAYPEMDKIITICKKYNVNIDDLLHKDIKEVKGEEDTKRKINCYMEAFFKFITDSADMFFRMKLGSKIKCLLEQGIIAFILMIIEKIIYGILETILHRSLLGLLPNGVYDKIEGFLGAIFVLVAFVLSIIIMVHIFKARYLDYYEKEENNSKENKNKLKETNQKIEWKKEDKIIVRDPKHSDHYFFKGLFQLFLLGIKLVAIEMEFFLCACLVFVGIGFVLSFLVSKTGIFFIGCLLGCLSSAVALGVLIILLFNFIFNRKGNKKLMIWSFVGSVLMIGISIGMVIIGSFNFELIEKSDQLKTTQLELEMKENYLISNDEKVEYIAEDRDNIRIEYKMDKNLVASYQISEQGVVHLYSYSENQMEYIKEFLRELNKKRIMGLEKSESIKVYASPTNLEKLKKNHDTYYDKLLNYEERINELEEEIKQKNQEIEELNTKIDGLEIKEEE